MTQRRECGGTYIYDSYSTRREEQDGVVRLSKRRVSIYDDMGSPGKASYTHGFQLP